MVHKIIPHDPVGIELLRNLLELRDALEKLGVMLLVLKCRERWRQILTPMEASLYSNMSDAENVICQRAIRHTWNWLILFSWKGATTSSKSLIEL